MGVEILKRKAERERAFDAQSVFCTMKGVLADYMHYAKSLRWEKLISKSQEVLRSTMEERETSNVKILMEVLKILKSSKKMCKREGVLHS